MQLGRPLLGKVYDYTMTKKKKTADICNLATTLPSNVAYFGHFEGNENYSDDVMCESDSSLDSPLARGVFAAWPPAVSWKRLFPPESEPPAAASPWWPTGCWVWTGPAPARQRGTCQRAGRGQVPGGLSLLRPDNRDVCR